MSITNKFSLSVGSQTDFLNTDEGNSQPNDPSRDREKIKKNQVSRFFRFCLQQFFFGVGFYLYFIIKTEKHK